MISDQAQRRVLDAQERLLRTQRRLTPGSIGGRSEQAQEKPTLPPPTPFRPTPEEKTFYLTGALSQYVGERSGVYTPRRRNLLIHVISELVVPGGTATVTELLRGGAHVMNITIPAGITHLITVVNEKFQINGQPIQFGMTTAGSGAQQLSQTVVLV